MTAQLVYLFSSDASPQYEADVLNILAAPKGAPWVFRYAQSVVAAGLGAKWGDASLEGAPCLVCFSLQQRSQYFDPAFIPIRQGTIRSTHVNGTQHLVEFELGDLVTLRPGGKTPEQLARAVREFTDWVRDNVAEGDTPYEASAGRGASVLETDLIWDEGPAMATIFEQATALLAGTDSFRGTRFLRFDSIVQNGETVWSQFGGKANVELTAGETYELRLVQYQPESVADRQMFAVNVGGDVVGIIGEPRFEVASRYDEVRIALHAQPVTGVQTRNTVLVVEPGAGVDGPRIELPLEIRPSSGRTVMSVLAPVGILAAVGLPSALDASTSLKVVLVIVGVVAAATVQLFGIVLPTVVSPFPAPGPSPQNEVSDGNSPVGAARRR